jgi:hypothetical protein
MLRSATVAGLGAAVACAGTGHADGRASLRLGYRPQLLYSWSACSSVA